MNRAEVVHLLELRRMQTGEQFDAAGAKADAWWDILADYDTPTVMRRYRELIRGGAEKVSLPMLVAGIQRDDTPRQAERVTPDGCDHHDTFAITDTHSRCNHCCADLYSQNDPRIASQWDRWVNEGRAQRDQARNPNLTEGAA